MVRFQISTKPRNPGALRLKTESQFGQARIEHGDVIVRVDAIPWESDLLDEGFAERVFGTPDAPATATWTFAKRDTADVVEMDITASEYAINTVEGISYFTNTSHDGKIGYLVFNRFGAKSENELHNAFAYLEREGITDLIVDFRYNGGGRVDITEFLSSLAERQGIVDIGGAIW